MKQFLTLASASALVFTFGVTTASADISCAVGDTLEQQGFDTGDGLVMRESNKGKSKGKGRSRGKGKGRDGDGHEGCDE